MWKRVRCVFSSIRALCFGAARIEETQTYLQQWSNQSTKRRKKRTLKNWEMIAPGDNGQISLKSNFFLCTNVSNYCHRTHPSYTRHRNARTNAFRDVSFSCSVLVVNIWWYYIMGGKTWNSNPNRTMQYKNNNLTKS